MQVVLVAVGIHQLTVALEALEFLLGHFVALLLVCVQIGSSEACEVSVSDWIAVIVDASWWWSGDVMTPGKKIRGKGGHERENYRAQSRPWRVDTWSLSV